MQKKSSLGLIFLIVFIDLIGFGIVIPILPYYAKAYGASAFMLGGLMTIYSLMQFLFSPIWGKLSDRIGRRPVLIYSILGTGLSFLILGFSRSLIWLFIGRTFGGICAANISTATAYIADITTPENRAKGMGLIGAAFGLGFIFGPAIGGVLSVHGYATPMFAAAGVSLINSIFVYLKLKEPPSTQESRQKNRSKRFQKQAWKEAFGDQRTRLAITIYFISTFAFTQMEVIFALFMKERFHFEAKAAGWLLAFMGTIMVLIQGGLIGKLSKKFGELNLIFIGTSLLVSGYLCTANVYTSITLILALSLIAFGNAILNPSLTSFASLGSLPERRGITMGVYQSAGSLARIFGPPIAGLAYDHIRITAPLYFSAFCLLIAFCILFFSRRNIVCSPSYCGKT